MQLFSEIPIPKPDFTIDYHDAIFCLGSCFATEIGNKIAKAKFQTLINPFGTQFHPRAMENVFSRIYSRMHYQQSEIFRHEDLYFSWDHGTQFSKPDLTLALNAVNQSVELGNEFLAKTNIFIFTLGTAWAYRLKDANFYVSNCHKVPQKHFKKILLSFDEIYNSVKSLILMARDVKPDCHIIFTISPVRHARDGYFENNLSKGLLHQVLFQILQEFDVNYFPSYEIVMDELRDYRYFAADLVHLNDLGLNYIWEKFKNHYFSVETIKIKQEIAKIDAALNHKSQNPKGTAHKKFLYDTLKLAENLSPLLPKQALQNEITELKNRIHAD